MPAKSLEERVSDAERGISITTILVADLLEITHRAAPKEFADLVRRRRMAVQAHRTGHRKMANETVATAFEESLLWLEEASGEPHPGAEPKPR